MVVVMSTPVFSHHSFAMYDQTVRKTVTGKVTRFVPGANHAQILFQLIGPDGQLVMENGKPVQWGIETASAAQIARQGVTVESFPPGTIMTVTLNPLRDGRKFGAMKGQLIGCGTTMPAGGCTEKTGKVYMDRGAE
jgi:hypothetical protein